MFASTYSLHMVLLLLTLGSKSKTNDQLRAVLRLPKDKSLNYEAARGVIENVEVRRVVNKKNHVGSRARVLSSDLSARITCRSTVEHERYRNGREIGRENG